MTPNPLAAMLDGELVQLLDIGARGGAHERWGRFEEFLEIVGFEPDVEECARLNRVARGRGRPHRFLPHALGAREEDCAFYVYNSPGLNGLYEPNRQFLERFVYGDSIDLLRTSIVHTTTLDSVAIAERLQPDYIKVDVQGAELDVLIGSQSIISGVKVVELEVEFNPQYLNQPLFPQIDLLLRTHGFMLLGLRRTYWRHMMPNSYHPNGRGGHIVHGDALYYNDKLLNGGQITRSDLAKWCILLSAYTSYDFLLSILYQCANPSHLSSQDRDQLIKLLIPTMNQPMRAITSLIGDRGYRKLQILLSRLFNPTSIAWHDPGFF